MIKIRRCVFETNSSSSHSIAVSKKDRGHNYNLPVDEFGVLTIPFGEFEWGPDLLINPIDKLSYCITDQFPFEELGFDYWKSLEDLGLSWEEACEKLKQTNFYQNLFKTICHNCPQVKDIKFEQGNRYDCPFGHIDHQSFGTSADSEYSIEEIVFNNSIMIVIDNDNGCCFFDYFPWRAFEAEKNIEDLFDGKWKK